MSLNHVQGADEGSVVQGSWWSKYSLLERRLIVSMVVISGTLLITLLYIYIKFLGKADPCVTLECVKSANDILNYIDENEDPCEDFYQFACGNFFKSPHVAHRNVVGTQEIMYTTLTNKIKQIIEEPRMKDDSYALTETKSFYRSCMNESMIDLQGVAVVKDMLGEIGGWPSLESNWKESEFDWKRATTKLRTMGYSFELFLTIDISVHSNDEVHVVRIKPPESKLLKLDDRYKDLHINFISGVSMDLGSPKNRAEREARDLLEFQDGLYKIVKRSEERTGNVEAYNPRTVSDLHYEIPNMPWFDYVNSILSPTAAITADETVNVWDIVYVKELLSLLRRADKRVLANFISWKFVDSVIDYMPKTFRERKAEYVNMVNRHNSRARWEVCLDSINSIMPFNTKDLLIQKYMTPTIKKTVKEIINNIKRRFYKHLNKFNWLDEQGYNMAKQKISSIVEYIANYGEGHSETDLDDIFQHLHTREDKILHSYFEFSKIKKNFEYKTLHKHITHELEEKGKIYSLKDNTITIPIDYLHGIYFDINRPNYFNYGAVGSIIAQELSNMFLDGRYYDVNGNLKEWSTSDSLSNYNKQLECFSHQFMEYYVPEVHKMVNMSLTQAEDMATLAGRKFAYEAYRIWVDNNEIEKPLPGIAYNQNQLFWISSTLHECQEISQELIKLNLKNKNMTLTKFRLNGSMRNLKEFVADFQCSIGTKMNAIIKCNMW